MTSSPIDVLSLAHAAIDLADYMPLSRLQESPTYRHLMNLARRAIEEDESARRLEVENLRARPAEGFTSGLDPSGDPLPPLAEESSLSDGPVRLPRVEDDLAREIDPRGR